MELATYHKVVLMSPLCPPGGDGCSAPLPAPNPDWPPSIGCGGIELSGPPGAGLEGAPGVSGAPPGFWKPS